MLMKVSVWLASWVEGAVCVAMMLVVPTRMGAIAVNVPVFMLFGDVQPHTRRHQRARDGELHSYWFAESDHGRCTAKERRG
jgi:hypothetical protein